jgi:hypothetical protein
MSINYESLFSSFNSGAHVEPQYNSPYGTSDAMITKTSVTLSTNEDLSPLMMQPSGSFDISFTDAITLSSERKFTCFPKLPDELKLRIWSFATPGQRVITIKQILHGFEESIHVRRYRIGRVMNGYRTPHKRTIPLIAIVKQPVTTAVCHDSRTVFLKQYPPCFELRLIHPVYFNMNRDTLLFEDIDVFLEFCELSYSSPKESLRLVAIADFTLRMPNIFNSPTCRTTVARTLASSPLVRNLQGLTILSSYKPPVESETLLFDSELRLALAKTHQGTHPIEAFNTTKTGSSHSTGPQIRYFYYRRRDNRKSVLAKVAIWE